MKCVATCLALAVSASAFAVPELTGLTVNQDGAKVLTVSFSLSEKAVVTMDILTNGVSIGADNYRTLREPLSPKDEFPANRIAAAGPHVWMWRPTREWPGYKFENGEFSVEVKAWSLDAPPDYMVLDSSSVSNAPAFYAKAEDLPEGGIKTADPEDADAVAALADDVYRKSKLVLRKIPAAGVKWRMGAPVDEYWRRDGETAHYVTLTNDYYVSIYPLTFSQSKRFLGLAETDSASPKYNLAFSSARGESVAGQTWPTDGHAVLAGSAFAYMRDRTGFRFDFLTEAEWEYACRAGTEGRWNDNSDYPTDVAWCNYTGSAKNHVVGLLKPNAWGLYDMHGLVQEWVLDQFGAYPDEPVVAPVGATGNPTRHILRGGPRAVKDGNGSYNYSVQISTRSAYRVDEAESSRQDGNNNGFGARVGCPASLPAWLR